MWFLIITLFLQAKLYKYTTSVFSIIIFNFRFAKIYKIFKIILL